MAPTIIELEPPNNPPIIGLDMDSRDDKPSPIILTLTIDTMQYGQEYMIRYDDGNRSYLRICNRGDVRIGDVHPNDEYAICIGTLSDCEGVIRCYYSTNPRAEKIYD